MEITEFVETLRLDGGLLADAAQEAGPDAAIPACPEWRIRDLVVHVGRVHRWATEIVAQGLQQPIRPAEAPDLTDDELVPWLREGHHQLVLALHGAPRDLTAWTILPTDSPLAFWARRQAHETSVHRVDAQQAAAASLTPLPSAFAADGVDELLTGLHSLERSKLRTDIPRTVRVRATDVPGADWTVHLSDAPPRAIRTTAAPAPGSPVDQPAADVKPVDCTIEGPAEELYLALWNRLPWDALTVTGEQALAELWREKGGI
ncbi:maleylpyruvate isomerase family mycothiol-dependent enzyme [Streptomyces sp. NRRL S-337]|uniref:maleylpyruvate isomerase family mycothiol-dependent enzyme n=1 Tax=Streptomyces sp. NRRL S-337 TaxID=1463900 RepID=UPI0004C7112B|nr:maleylpyruvate isomerase family mycothiol-dependent enzyme [Streptomyces sp. NRRL S-337]